MGDLVHTNEACSQPGVYENRFFFYIYSPPFEVPQITPLYNPKILFEQNTPIMPYNLYIINMYIIFVDAAELSSYSYVLP